MKQSKLFLGLGLVAELARFVILYLWYYSVVDAFLPGPGKNLIFFLLAAPQLIFPAAFIMRFNFPDRYDGLKGLLIPFKSVTLISAAVLALLTILASYAPFFSWKAWAPALPLLAVVVLDGVALALLGTMKSPDETLPEVKEVEIKNSEESV